MKIAVVIPTQPNINSSLHNLLKVYEYLIRKYKVEVTIFTDKKNNFHYKNFGIQKINGIDYKTPLEKILLFLGLQRNYYTDLVEKLKGYDVIETSNPEFYWFAYKSYIAAKKYNSKLIYRTSQTVDGFYLFKFTKFIAVSIAKKAYSYASWLLFTNPQSIERCIRLGLVDKNSKKIVLLGHATDTKTFKPLKTEKEKDKKEKYEEDKDNKRKNNTILLSVGGLYKIKGHHLIIQSLKNLIEKGFNAELWIVGDGYYKNALIELVKKLDIEKNVKFFGSKEHKELAKIYNQCDIFVLANAQEITPAANEAMACEKPVVIMECGGLDYVIPNEDYGMTSRKFDIEDMAQKIIYLIENKEIAARIAKNGRKRITENFSIEKVGEKFYKCFVR